MYVCVCVAELDDEMLCDVTSPHRRTTVTSAPVTSPSMTSSTGQFIACQLTRKYQQRWPSIKQ